MDKILVAVYVPITGMTYDIFIPRGVQVYEILDLMKKAVTELSEGLFTANADTAVFFMEDGRPLDINRSAEEQGVLNGSKLMLI